MEVDAEAFEFVDGGLDGACGAQMSASASATPRSTVRCTRRRFGSFVRAWARKERVGEREQVGGDELALRPFDSVLLNRVRASSVTLRAPVNAPYAAAESGEVAGTSD